MRKIRRSAREAALKAIYQLEVAKGTVTEAVVSIEKNTSLDGDLLVFARDLVNGVSEERSFLNEQLEALIQGFSRIAVIDRCVLRIAAYELFFCPTIPPFASVNEAVDLVKKYSTAESGRFVNGVLARLVERSPKSNWQQTEGEKISTPRGGC